MNNYELTIYQGQTYASTFAITDSTGGAMNLSGTIVSGYLKTNYGNTGKLADLNATVSGIASSGIVALSLHATGTAALPISYAFYDVEALFTGDGTVLKLMGGKASIFPEVTY